MRIRTDPRDRWPALDYAAWSDTATTLQLWSQVVGKIALVHAPWLNHGWHLSLRLDPRGLATAPIHFPGGLFRIAFDFVEHRLVVITSTAPSAGFALAPMSVAAFHRRLVALLEEHGIDPTIHLVPNEVPDPIPFPDDEVHAAYDAEAVQRYWRALVAVDAVLERFRTGFLGKASPVHLFWGSFDLAVTRFSGRSAPLHPGGVPGLPDAVTREAYSHEVSSAGFWPGSAAYPRAAFYAYAYPKPAGFGQAPIEPEAATWTESMGEWLLPYDAVRNAVDPDAALLAFLRSTYRAAADLAHWDPSLDCELGVAGRPRAVAHSSHSTDRNLA